MLTIAANPEDHLELLCCLSRTPARIEDLCRDLSWNEFKLRNVVAKRLREKMRLRVFVSKGTVWIDDCHWEQAYMVALGYFERTYNN